jgi:O-antigen ligase
MCLVCGLFFFWDTVSRWGQRKQRRAKRIILLNAALLAMTLWLLYLSNSATSRICLLLGCVIIAVAQTQWVKRRPLVLKVTIPVCFFIYLIVAFGFDLNGQLAGAVGRDPTLTDRTKIWAGVLSMHTNPILGTGYESFWLGPRLQKLWLMPGLGHINEAHNGYLEVYLNQGIAGVLFLVGLLIASYRTIWKRLSAGSSLASLMLAVWAIVIFYDMTEAGFRSGLLFMTLLMGAMPAARRAARRAPSPALWDADPAPQVPAPLFETTSQRR